MPPPSMISREKTMRMSLLCQGPEEEQSWWVGGHRSHVEARGPLYLSLIG